MNDIVYSSTYDAWMLSNTLETFICISCFNSIKMVTVGIEVFGGEDQSAEVPGASV